MQPTYLPWLGWFDLLDQVDTFVLLDDVAFSKQSWQQRNRIKGHDGLQWLTVPVLAKGRHGQALIDVELADASFAARHLRTIAAEYARADHLHPHLEQLGDALHAGAASMRLAELNIVLIGLLANWLGVSTPVFRSSQLEFGSESDVGGHRVGRLVQLCNHFAADVYVTVPGALDYLDDEAVDVFGKAGVEVRVHRYEHPLHPQLHGAFVSHAAAVDLVLNVGQEARDTLLRGRRDPDRLGRHSGG